MVNSVVWLNILLVPYWCMYCSRSFIRSIVIRFAGFCYGWFMAMRYKFNLVTYVQRPLVIDRRGGTERNLNEITAGSRGRKAVAYERNVSASDRVY